MIEIGDKLICINNGDFDGKLDNATLTINKAYEVLKLLNGGIGIQNDFGEFNFYIKERFISLAQYRERQINSILND